MNFPAIGKFETDTKSLMQSGRTTDSSQRIREFLHEGGTKVIPKNGISRQTSKSF